MGTCAPAVVPRYAHLPFRDANHRIVNLRQFVWMHGIFEFVRRLGQCGKIERIAAKQETMAIGIGQSRPANAGSVAALLRYEIPGHTT